MSSFRLPVELIEFVVDQLTSQPHPESLNALIACCTVHRDFTDLCQREIFRAVTLYQPYPEEPDIRYRYRPLNPKDLIRTPKFVDAVRRRPILASYVRVLQYEVTCREGEVTEDERAAISAAQRMTNLVNLTIGWTGPRGDLGNAMEKVSTHRAALFSSLLRGSDKLQSLTLHELVLLGPEFCLWVPTTLQRLELVNCLVLFSPSARGPIPPIIRNRGKAPPLKHLTCNIMGVEDFVGIDLQLFLTQSHGIDFTRLESLELHVENLRSHVPRDAHIRLLHQASCIQTMSISFHEYDYQPIWNCLNTSSFLTLTNFTLVFVTTLPLEFTFQEVISVAKEGYLNTFHGDATLTTLVKLTHLRILIIIQGNWLIVDSGCCEHSCNELFDDAKRIGDTVETLKEVRLMLHIRKQRTECPPEGWTEEVPPDPYDYLPDFVDIPHQNRFEMSDVLGHSLKVAVSTGPCVDQRHPRMKYIERNL